MTIILKKKKISKKRLFWADRVLFKTYQRVPSKKKLIKECVKDTSCLFHFFFISLSYYPKNKKWQILP